MFHGGERMTGMYLENTLLLEQFGETGIFYPMELRYYLLESEITMEEELIRVKTYGVGIIKETREECSEARLVENFSSSLARTKEVLNLLVRNSVTPISLYNVLEDIAGL